MGDGVGTGRPTEPGRALWSFAVWISSACMLRNFKFMISSRSWLMMVNHVVLCYRKVLILGVDIRILESQLSFRATPLENPMYWAASQLLLHLLFGFVATHR